MKYRIGDKQFQITIQHSEFLEYAPNARGTAIYLNEIDENGHVQGGISADGHSHCNPGRDWNPGDAEKIASIKRLVEQLTEQLNVLEDKGDQFNRLAGRKHAAERLVQNLTAQGVDLETCQGIFKAICPEFFKTDQQRALEALYKAFKQAQYSGVLEIIAKIQPPLFPRDFYNNTDAVAITIQKMLTLMDVNDLEGLELFDLHGFNAGVNEHLDEIEASNAQLVAEEAAWCEKHCADECQQPEYGCEKNPK